MTACAFTDALCALAPAALVTRRRESDWCSATFTGKRLTLDLQWQDTGEEMQDFLRRLPDHEFSLSDIVVADIAGTLHEFSSDRASLTIEALLLHDVA